MGRATLDTLLDAAVSAVGGETRPGQIEMAAAVHTALADGDPLLVEAGTGTGKSLAYLVPAIAHCLDRRDRRVVVATATLALQRQLVAHDLPLIAGALAPHLPREPRFALLKGRNNYVCRHKIDTAGTDDEDGLFNPSELTELGQQVIRVREWAQESDTGDRDDLVPGVNDRVWNTMSVSARECLGAAKCPFGVECFAEAARDKAREADVVVTNHALLAIGTFDSDLQVLPEHDAVIIDEAHELVNRATGASSGELTAGMVERAARAARKHLDETNRLRLDQSGELLKAVLDTAAARRYPQLPEDLEQALVSVRDNARTAFSAIGKARDKSGAGDDGGRRRAQAAVELLVELADRLLLGAPEDVIWLDRSTSQSTGRSFSTLCVAPLSVSQALRHRLFARTHVVLTSATLKLGGDFDGVARTLGLYPQERADRLPADQVPAREPEPEPAPASAKVLDYDAEPDEDEDDDLGEDFKDHPIRWNALDVGSPFDYPKQGILYIARHLPPPGRDGTQPEHMDELAALIEAAGGRTLGLFSSMRGARAAAEAISARLDFPVLCQGEDSLPQLIAKFLADPRTCLFGTLSLWQGVNVPGPSCQLVVIDRIPFPRPDDPLATARQEAVARAGGNGFMSVAAAHAALLLAQGAGRLIRTAGDRGVVAVLDSRLATARYASYLRASLPGFWPSNDTDKVLAALRRLDVDSPV
ncbi:MAG TPA: ATP-dependent DNA helicase [Actinocrinis sp.]|nr:ATP-dependent DNA helicase [Actinocrinis sp.]